jgi:hypothetical protein
MELRAEHAALTDDAGETLSAVRAASEHVRLVLRNRVVRVREVETPPVDALQRRLRACHLDDIPTHVRDDRSVAEPDDPTRKETEAGLVGLLRSRVEQLHPDADPEDRTPLGDETAYDLLESPLTEPSAAGPEVPDPWDDEDVRVHRD